MANLTSVTPGRDIWLQDITHNLVYADYYLDFKNWLTPETVASLPWDNSDFNPSFLVALARITWEQALYCGRGDVEAISLFYHNWMAGGSFTLASYEFVPNRDKLKALGIPEDLIGSLIFEMWSGALGFDPEMEIPF